MTTALTKRLARAVLIAGLALPASALLPATATFAISKAYAAPATIAEFKSVLATYGKWGTHDRYGDIWVPTVTPAGWHPYPACQWVYTMHQRRPAPPSHLGGDRGVGTRNGFDDVRDPPGGCAPQRCAWRGAPYFLAKAIVASTALMAMGVKGCSLTKV